MTKDRLGSNENVRFVSGRHVYSVHMVSRLSMMLGNSDKETLYGLMYQPIVQPHLLIVRHRDKATGGFNIVTRGY